MCYFTGKLLKPNKKCVDYMDYSHMCFPYGFQAWLLIHMCFPHVFHTCKLLSTLHQPASSASSRFSHMHYSLFRNQTPAIALDKHFVIFQTTVGRCLAPSPPSKISFHISSIVCDTRKMNMFTYRECIRLTDSFALDTRGSNILVSKYHAVPRECV